MPSICFLTSTRGAPRNDNHRRLPDGVDRRRLERDARRSRRRAPDATRRLRRADDAPLDRLRSDLADRPRRARRRFSTACSCCLSIDAQRFVTSPRALLMHHAKYSLALGTARAASPTDVREPRSALVAAASPRRAATGSQNRPPRASAATCIGARGRSESRRHSRRADRLRRARAIACCSATLPEIERGETRVLLAGGEFIGAYLRARGFRPSRESRAATVARRPSRCHPRNSNSRRAPRAVCSRTAFASLRSTSLIRGSSNSISRIPAGSRRSNG